MDQDNSLMTLVKKANKIFNNHKKPKQATKPKKAADERVQSQRHVIQVSNEKEFERLLKGNTSGRLPKPTPLVEESSESVAKEVEEESSEEGAGVKPIHVPAPSDPGLTTKAKKYIHEHRLVELMNDLCNDIDNI